MKTKNNLVVKNPFRFYRYEVPNAMVRFAFSDKFVYLRKDRNDAGWDDITDIITLEKLPKTNRIRMEPFLGEISEQYYLENSSIIDLQDCIITQDWASDPSDDTQLLNLLNNDSIGFPEKITEDIFITIFINEKYTHVDDRILTIEDIHSLQIEFQFSTDYATDEVELLVNNLEFMHPEDICLIVKDDDPYSNILIIDESIFDYYFNIKGNGQCVKNLLSQEYLITPAMVLDYELYMKIQNKIESVRYETVAHF
jgi:hypothetical protein